MDRRMFLGGVGASLTIPFLPSVKAIHPVYVPHRYESRLSTQEVDLCYLLAEGFIGSLVKKLKDNNVTAVQKAIINNKKQKDYINIYFDPHLHRAKRIGWYAWVQTKSGEYCTGIDAVYDCFPSIDLNGNIHYALACCAPVSMVFIHRSHYCWKNMFDHGNFNKYNHGRTIKKLEGLECL